MKIHISSQGYSQRVALQVHECLWVSADKLGKSRIHWITYGMLGLGLDAFDLPPVAVQVGKQKRRCIIRLSYQFQLAQLPTV